MLLIQALVSWCCFPAELLRARNMFRLQDTIQRASPKPLNLTPTPSIVHFVPNTDALACFPPRRDHAVAITVTIAITSTMPPPPPPHSTSKPTKSTNPLSLITIPCHHLLSPSLVPIPHAQSQIKQSSSSSTQLPPPSTLPARPSSPTTRAQS